MRTKILAECVGLVIISSFTRKKNTPKIHKAGIKPAFITGSGFIDSLVSYRGPQTLAFTNKEGNDVIEMLIIHFELNYQLLCIECSQLIDWTYLGV